MEEEFVDLPIPEPEQPAPEVERDDLGRIKHPVCGHWEYEDRIDPKGGPCKVCIKQIEKEYANRQPHPHCGCLKPVWSHRTDGGPCGWCLKDIEREYAVFFPQDVNDYLYTIEDVRTWRAPLLLETDWVDNNPARVAREPEAYVQAIHAYRQLLFDITKDFNGYVEFPQKPERTNYGTS